jgi:hypothetical protein
MKFAFGFKPGWDRADLDSIQKRSLSEDKALEQKTKVRAQLLQNLQRHCSVKS